MSIGPVSELVASITDVTTANGEVFSSSDSCNLAWLIYRRWNRDLSAGAIAYRRLMQNFCSDHQFAIMVGCSDLNDENTEEICENCPDISASIDIAKELGVSEETASGIEYLRTRSRWTPELEQKVIDADKAGKSYALEDFLSGMV